MKSLRTRFGFLLLLCVCVGAVGAAGAEAELPAKWLESPAYQNLVPLDALKTLMPPVGDLPVPPGVTAQWTKGLPLIQPGEEVEFGGQTFVRRSSIQMHNLKTPDRNSQMMNLRVFTGTDFPVFYPADSAETAQYFREVRDVDVGTDGQLMTQTLPGGLESSSVAFRLGEIGFSATAVIDGDIDGIPLALGAAKAWVRYLQSAKGPAGDALRKEIVTTAAPERAATAPADVTVSGPDLLADLKEAAELGVVQAQLRLIEIYQDGAEGVEPDPVKAVYWAKQAADKGNAQAQCALGSYYDFGVGVEQDQTEAVRWYEQSAAQGNEEAAFNVALSYLRGEGVEPDPIEALRYFQQAAKAGMPQAQYRLASLYDSGTAVAMDKEMAATWYRKAAEQGLPLAQNDLGVGYLRGEGVEQDGAQAFAWFAKSAEAGLPMGMYNLGACFNTGTGTEQDIQQAFVWFARSAGAGYPNAMVELALAYLQGKVVEQDEDLARIWLERAIEAGNEQAADILRQLDEPPPPPPQPEAPPPKVVPPTVHPERPPAPKPPKRARVTDTWQLIEYPSLPHTFKVPEEWSLDQSLLDDETIQAYSAPTELPGMLIMYHDVGEQIPVSDLKEVLAETILDAGEADVLTPPKEIRVNSVPAVYLSATMDFNGIPSVADVMCVNKGTGLYIIITASFKGDSDARKTNKRVLKSFRF